MHVYQLARRHLWRAVAVAALFAGTAQAQTPQPVRLRATIDTVTADSISVTTRGGEVDTVMLTPKTGVSVIAPVSLADIKPGSFIGTAAMPQADGTQRALEVHVFPESMRGTGEGFRPFDLQPQSTMTNGTVGSVTGSSGRTLTIGYKGGKQTVVVPPGTPVVTFEPGSRDMLTPGAHVIVFAAKAVDGTLTANRVAVGKNGLVPPM